MLLTVFFPLGWVAWLQELEFGAYFLPHRKLEQTVVRHSLLPGRLGSGKLVSCEGWLCEEQNALAYFKTVLLFPTPAGSLRGFFSSIQSELELTQQNKYTSLWLGPLQFFSSHIYHTEPPAIFQLQLRFLIPTLVPVQTLWVYAPVNSHSLSSPYSSYFWCHLLPTYLCDRSKKSCWFFSSAFYLLGCCSNFWGPYMSDRKLDIHFQLIFLSLFLCMVCCDFCGISSFFSSL